MRIALCFVGLTGSVDFGYGLGKPVDPRIAHHHHKKYIIDENKNVDVFIHSWSTEFKKMLIDLYQPKKYIIENQIDFGRDTIRNNSTISRWYSTEMVSNLVGEYESENKFEYDWVMVYRLDHVFLTPLNFSKFDNNFIYFRHSNGLAAPQGFSHGYDNKKCTCYDKKGPHGLRLYDAYAFSNSNNMKKFSSVYSYHYENNIPFDMSPHDECYVQLNRHSIENKLKFAFYGMDPWPEKNITQTECVRAIYKNPEYVDGSDFDINKLSMFDGNPGRNQEVRRRFGVWGVPDVAKDSGNKEKIGFGKDIPVQ